MYTKIFENIVGQSFENPTSNTSKEELKSLLSDLQFGERIIVLPGAGGGFDDLLKDGSNVKGFYVGFKHNSRGSSEKRMRQSVEDAAYILNDHFFNGDGVVEDYWDVYDMYRVYVKV